jgi:protein-S-isoprenylcysteine O-methyltransferase Ste14
VILPAIILWRTNALHAPGWHWLFLPGGLLILGGLALVVWVCQAFVRYGHGTPAPFDPPRKFVNRGLYRWVRNPMYLGAGILIPLGEALIFKSWWLTGYMVCAFTVLHLYIVLIEEKALERRFGRPYQKYKRTVPRWIPRKPQD